MSAWSSVKLNHIFFWYFDVPDKPITKLWNFITNLSVQVFSHELCDVNSLDYQEWLSLPENLCVVKSIAFCIVIFQINVVSLFVFFLSWHLYYQSLCYMVCDCSLGIFWLLLILLKTKIWKSCQNLWWDITNRSIKNKLNKH